MKDIETGEIDYNQLRDMAKKHKPKVILAGFSAYPRELDYAKFAEIGQEVNAVLMADMAHIAGLIAGKALRNPFDYGFHVMTSTTHKTLRGPRGGLIMTRGIVSNPLKKPPQTVENLPTIIDRTLFPGVQGGPHMHAIAAKAVSFYEALQPSFEAYAHQVIKNAKVLADELMKRGFKLVTNGTDNHLILCDVKTSFDLDGKIVEETLDSIGLTLNKNAIANDTLPPFSPSGIRLGTPAMTTRGLKEEHMSQIAEWMHRAIQQRTNKKVLHSISQEVSEFAGRFPLPSDV
jgi:glycine hydroxymethyltransferase